MAVQIDVTAPSKKRKLIPNVRTNHAPKRPAAPSSTESSTEREIRALEQEVSESGSKLNNVAILLTMFNLEDANEPQNFTVALSLCRIFSRLMVNGSLISGKPDGQRTHDAPADLVSSWLLQRYLEYQKALVKLLRNGQDQVQIIALKLSLRMLKEQPQNMGGNFWVSDEFRALLTALVEAGNGERVRAVYTEEYMTKYSDCMFYSLDFIASYPTTSRAESVGENVFNLLSALGEPPSSLQDLPGYYAEPTKAKGKNIITSNSLKRRAESAWIALLRCPSLSEPVRKKLLRQSTTIIMPWILRPEVLMDFFTDSYNAGGSMSLLALSGLFHLINTKNLDYPSFYPKLYSLLDADLLHSKHRSRFFRLLVTFLSSSHLPASLIASFIKRLSRLSLFGAPAAVVAVIPHIYNLLRSHPSCTLMIHRQPYPPYTASEDHVGKDPFSMFEPDPQLTHAIDSSLWELETLQSHYHPNVAALARIISEQFTKQSYSLEDFLDHGYASMVDGELGKEAKTAPVVEWRIPKNIISRPAEGEVDQSGQLTSLVMRLWTFD